MSAVARPELLEADIEAISPNPWNRKKFDETKLGELAASITKVGILQPIVTRPDPKDEARFQIVAGERRWRAAKKAKLSVIPITIRELTDLEVVELMAIENAQREDVHPLEEAEQYDWLRKHGNGKYDVAAIASKVGKSPSYVYQRLKLADLIEPAKKAFQEEKITAGHAILIARLQPGDQKAALSACFDRYGDRGLVSVRALAQFIERDLHLDLGKAVFDTTRLDLVPAAGACSTCPKRSGANPDLFGDLGKNVCTDRRCFEGKLEAHLKDTKTKLEAKGEKVVAITTDWGYSGNDEKRLSKAGIVKRGDWHEAKKSDPKAVTALIVEGQGKGGTMTVTLGKPRPERREASAQEQRWRKQRSQDKARQERAEAMETALIVALKDKLPAKMDAALLRTIAENEIDNGFADSAEICRLYGWEPKGKGWNATTKAVKAGLAKLSEGALAQLLQLLRAWELPTNKLIELARKHKVDVKAIEQKVKLEATRKKTGWKVTDGGCEVCQCTEDNACEGGCSWDPAFLKAGRAVCSSCTDEATPLETSAKTGKTPKGKKKMDRVPPRRPAPGCRRLASSLTNWSDYMKRVSAGITGGGGRWPA
jgi:ParB/RepB/Spo0J family partition protein